VGLLALGLVASGLLAARLSRAVQRPLGSLRAGAERLGSEDLEHRVAIEGDAEFRQLARSFNAMADELLRGQSELTRRAFYDPLTGLANRALVSDRLRRALADRGPSSGQAAFLFLDLDGFKDINDRLGHVVGDQLLTEIGARLAGAVRSHDTVGRIGGDEFAVVLERLEGHGDAERVAERLLAVLAEPIVTGTREIVPRASIGIAIATGGSDVDADEMLRRADVAMYAAKAAPGSSFRTWSPELDRAPSARLELEVDLRRAVEADAIDLHFQPIVDLETGDIVAVEALARWTHPDRGPIPPPEFISLAEESGLIRPLGRQLLHRACVTLGSLTRELRMPPMLSVNLSVAQLHDPDLIDAVRHSLDESGLDPARLVFEVTESVLMEDVASTTAKLGELRALGVHLALDDFGTGYSSLSYLQQFPIDVIKIDKSFVQGLGRDTGLVRAILAMAEGLGMEAIAEGIETHEQRRLLQELGCRHGQGYLFARPLPASGLAEVLELSSAGTRGEQRAERSTVFAQ
jgi:diguanylate cyclase (GGDEF)-like protein